MEIQIITTDESLSNQEIKKRLESLPEWDNSISLEIRREEQDTLRSLDPTVLAAVLAMTGTALGALMTGLLQIAQAKNKEKIVLVTKEGLRIEVEAVNAQKKIPELIKLLKSMEINILRI